MMANSKDNLSTLDTDLIKGTQFGDWIIVGLKEYRIRNKKTGKRGSFWLRECCRCGTRKWVDRTSLIGGTSKNCGCLRAETLNRNRKVLPDGEATFNLIYAHYKANAKRHNRLWELSREEFRTLTQSACFYCGVEPSTYMRANKTITPYKYNGIDRRDNEQGYTLSNSVPCCKICNYAKKDLTEEEFLNWAKRVVLHRNL